MTDASLGGLQVGDQLGNLEYVIDQETLDRYRVLVGGDGHYPNLLADDCRVLLVQRCGALPLTTSWQRFEFMRPPVLGRRVQVGGWLREIDHIDAWPRLWVAAFAVDEIGTEIMRSEAVFLVRGPAQHDDLGGVAEPTGHAKGAAASPSGYDGPVGISVGDALGLGVLALPEGDRLSVGLSVANGLAGFDLNGQGHDSTPIIGGWLEAGIGRWVWR